MPTGAALLAGVPVSDAHGAHDRVIPRELPDRTRSYVTGESKAAATAPRSSRAHGCPAYGIVAPTGLATAHRRLGENGEARHLLTQDRELCVDGTTGPGDAGPVQALSAHVAQRLGDPDGAHARAGAPRPDTGSKPRSRPTPWGVPEHART
ncbi:hypothetical protein [Streptomyces sp. NPDC001770]